MLNYDSYYRSTCNSVKKKSSRLFKNIIKKMCLQVIYLFNKYI